MRQRPKIEIIGVEIFYRFAACPFDFRLEQRWCDCSDDACGSSVLQIEDIFQTTVEPVRPKMSAGCRVDQLAGDTQSASRFADAAFQHVAYSQLLGHLAHVHRAAL